MPIKKARTILGEYKANGSKWDEAVSDAKKKIKELRYSIRVFKARKKAGEPWPTATHN
jgi:hypothetical protein